MDTHAIPEDLTKEAMARSSTAEGSTSVQRPRGFFAGGSREPEIDLPTVIAVLRRRKGVLVGTVLVVSALTLLILLQITPLYTGSATLMRYPGKAMLEGAW